MTFKLLYYFGAAYAVGSIYRCILWIFQSLNKAIHHLHQRSEINHKNFASHSSQIGMATTDAAAGLPVWLIKTLRQWNSNAYLSYICYPIAVLATVLRILANADPTYQPPWEPDLLPSYIKH